MPGIRGQLGIRVNDGTTDRLVTQHCRGLKFTKVAPGGHQSLAFTMTLPRDTFNDLGPQDRCYVYDARTGRTVIEGYLENPTPTDGPDGQQFDVSAVGGMALASDETRALIYVDKSLDAWYQILYPNAHPASSASTYTDSVGVQSLRASLPRGLVLGGSAVLGGLQYDVLDRAGMQPAGIRVITQSGKTDANYRVQFSDFISATTNIGDTAQMSTAAFDQTQWIGSTISTSATKLRLWLLRTGAATTVADDTTWTNFTGVSVLGRRMDRNGNLLSTATAHGNTALSVLASQVVEDLLGRILTMCDAATAQVDATTYAIDQLAYPDGVKAADVFNDLALYEDNIWEILESGTNGKHRFNYRAWPTMPRYVVSVQDGWQQTGSDVDLCNRIHVSWTDAAGNIQSTPITAASVGLTDPFAATGRIKDADPVTLPDGAGSLANATRIGTQILADKINPPLAGTVTVSRPIMDLLTGHTVMPWELEPGYLCRVRETGEDLRITQADYDDDSCSMLLTLGTPVRSTEQRLARLARAA